MFRKRKNIDSILKNQFKWTDNDIKKMKMIEVEK